MNLRSFLKVLGLVPVISPRAFVVIPRISHPNSINVRWSDDPVDNLNICAKNSITNLVANEKYFGGDAFTVAQKLRSASDFCEESLLLNLAGAIIELRKLGYKY